MRFTVIVTALLLGFTMFGVWTFYAMKTLNVNGPLYQRIVQGKDIVADVLPPPEYIIESYLVALQLKIASDPVEISQLIARFQVLKDEYESRHSYWLEQSLEKELKASLLEQSYQHAQSFYQEALEHYLPAIQMKNTDAAQRSLQKIQETYEKHRGAINETVRYTNERNKRDEEQAALKIHWHNGGLASIFVFSVLIAMMLTWIISRGIIRQLGGEPVDVCNLAANIARGKLDNSIAVKAGDNESIVANMQQMQQKLLALMNQEAEEKARALRINQALDNVKSGVMVTDSSHNIIYMNKAVQKLFRDGEQEIQKELPQFDAQKLMGSSIDMIHKNPAQQRGLLDKLTGPYESEINMANLHLSVVVSPVINQSNEQIGFVAEWVNRIHEVILDQEVSNVVIAATQGDFSNRINEQDKSGIFLKLSQTINQLMETSSLSLNDMVRVLNALSHGDLTEKITTDYLGTFKQLKDDANTTVDSLKALINDIKMATSSINIAAKEIASGNHDLSQRTEEQAASLEETAASMDELTSAVNANTENAKQASELARGATEVADKGVVVVLQVVTTMESINESSRKITEIISVIDGIAFQTNILALNAAVEAARAGDQGRGFAVVAGEVRNLAQRAATAADEIKTLILDSEEKVASGTKLVARAGTTMQEIVEAISDFTGIITQIASASVEQSLGIAQVNQAVRQIDDVTQQNAALVEQAAAAAESLEEQTEYLTADVAKFKVDEGSMPATLSSDSAKQVKVTPIQIETHQNKASSIIKPNLQKDKKNDEWELF